MSLPDTITTVTVTGAYLTPDGEAAKGSVSFAPSITAASAGVIMPVAAYVVELDENGEISVDLAATDDPSWEAAGFTYLVTERIAGARPRSYSISVPAASPGGTLDLATVVPVVAATDVTPYLLAASNLADLDDADEALENLGLGVHGDSAAVTVNATANQWPSGSTLTVYEDRPGFCTLVGGIEGTGSNSSGTTLITLPAGFRPDRDCQFTLRHTGTGASTGTVSVNATTGAVTYNSGFNSGAFMDFTGVTYKKAA